MNTRHKLNTLKLTTALSISLLFSPTAFAEEEYDKSNDPWYLTGQETLAKKLEQQPNTRKAKNVIVFIADGLGVMGSTAGRIYDGQQKGMDGEENFLFWERFPHLALAKTYGADVQVSDSANTASAIATGIKSNDGTVSVPSSVPNSSCEAFLAIGGAKTIAEIAAEHGKATGVITTTAITDATPATFYAHSPNRRWMDPSRMPEEAIEMGCKDTASQLLTSDMTVALGGGRLIFTPTSVTDPETTDRTGARPDERNLIEEWLEAKPAANYAASREELMALDLAETESLLGLFALGSMVFEDESADDGMSNPSLAEMTSAAIDVLSKDEDGFFLMVEHEGTDDLQHQAQIVRFLDSVLEFSEAIQVASEKVDLSETLIVVTSDHGQAINLIGPAPKGNPVLGLARNPGEEPSLAGDEKPYPTLSFLGGPGYAEERADLREVDTYAKDFIGQGYLPIPYVPHTGEDVPVYASGPWAHLFDGLIEQSTIFHLINHAMDPEQEG